MESQVDGKRRKIFKIAIIAIIVLGIVLAAGLITRAVNGDLFSRKPVEAVTPQVAADPLDRYNNLSDFVQRFYGAYLATPQQGSTVDATRSLALKGYGDENAIANFVAHEKQCIQNTPSGVEVQSVEGIANPYRADVTYDYAGSDGVPVVLTVLDGGGYFVIHDISCS